MTTTLTTYRPSLLGSNVFDNIFDNFFTDFPRHMNKSTSGYPVADIYRDNEGNTVMDFALAGFSKEDLTVDVQPEKRTITVSANDSSSEARNTRRIARRRFQKTYVNYDDNLDLSRADASFVNGLLTVTIPQRAEVKPLNIEIHS